MPARWSERTKTAAKAISRRLLVSSPWLPSTISRIAAKFLRLGSSSSASRSRRSSSMPW
jgi:hypothetical protein